MTSPDFVVASGLTASYGRGDLRVPVLEGASFSLRRGAVTAVVGPSGSGKSTLLALLGGLDRAERGQLVVDGVDLAALSTGELTRYRATRVGFVFQFFNLVPNLDARENVEAGLAPVGVPASERRALATAALEAVGLASKSARFPHELSGGEQQRVAIARAFAKRPPLLLADEPTGNLDVGLRDEVLGLLLADRDGPTPRTVVIVTHDPDVAARADRRLRIEGRRVRDA